MALSRREINKDALQQATEAAISSVGHVSAIVIGAVREITTEVGTFATEVFEIREASRRADDDAEAGEDTNAGDTNAGDTNADDTNLRD